MKLVLFPLKWLTGFANADVGNTHSVWVEAQCCTIIDCATAFVPNITPVLIEDLIVPLSGVLVHNCIATAKSNIVKVSVFNLSKRDNYIKQPFRLGILSPANIIDPRIKVTMKIIYEEISIDLNDKKESKEQDYACIEEIYLS